MTTNTVRAVLFGMAILSIIATVSCGSTDEQVELAGSCVQDANGDGFLTLEEYRVGLDCAVDDFAWPEGMKPDAATLDWMILEFSNQGPVGLQRGMEYVNVGGINECAWNKTWLEARERGVTATETSALDYMTNVVPHFGTVIPNFPDDAADRSVVIHQEETAAKASLGDPSLVQQNLTYGCVTLDWLPGAREEQSLNGGTPP